MAEKETFAERLVGGAIRLYSRSADRAAMPTNRRVFLDSVVDKRKDPITESSFTPAELTELSNVVAAKYAPLREPVNQYAAYLQKRLASHEAAVKAKNPDKMMYPEAVAQFQNDLTAIQAFNAGKLTQDFLGLASGKQTYFRDQAMREASRDNKDLRDIFKVKPSVQYSDYDPASRPKARSIFSSSPSAMLQTTLGRFNYDVDPKTGGLVITDSYDFNPPQNLITNAPAPARPIGEGDLADAELLDGGTGYGLIRQWAGRAMPPGTGRPVRIQTNALAPPMQNNLAK
jgi:hypothetical protein